jgi:hypothetical protein
LFILPNYFKFKLGFRVPDQKSGYLFGGIEIGIFLVSVFSLGYTDWFEVVILLSQLTHG